MGKRSTRLSISQVHHYISGILVGLICLVIAVCGYYVYRRYRLVPDVQEQLREVQDNRISRMLSVMQELTEHVTQLARDEDVLSYMRAMLNEEGSGAPSQEKDLPDSIKRFPHANNIILVQLDGTVVSSYPSDTFSDVNIPNDMPDTILSAVFDRVSKTLTVDTSEYGIQQQQDKPVLYISVPLIDQGQYIGVVIVELVLDAIQQIITDYQGLQTTGEIVVARDADGGAFFVFQTRYDPHAAFSRYISEEQLEAYPIRRAIQGYVGKGVARDYRDTSVIAVWSFVPHVNWGIVTKIDYAEAYRPLNTALTLWISTLIVLLLVTGAFVFVIYPAIRRYAYATISYYTKWIDQRTIVWGLGAMSAIGLLVTISSLFMRQQRSIEQTYHQSLHKAQEHAYHMGEDVNSVARIAHAIARDIENGRLQKEDISIRLRRVMQENTRARGVIVAFTPYSYSSDKRLVAPMAYRMQGTLHEISFSYDYTQKAGAGEPQTHWYRNTVNGSSQWLLPYYDAVIDARVVPYAVPFTDPQSGEVAGVVTTFLDYAVIERHMQRLQLGAEDIGVVIHPSGSFIYHSQDKYVEQSASFIEIAQKQDSEGLVRIANDMQEGKSNAQSYYDTVNGQTMWCVYTPVEQTQWSLGIIFPESKGALPDKTLYNWYLWIFVWSVLASVFCILCVMYKPPMQMHTAWSMAMIVSGILGGALLLFWYFLLQFFTYEISHDRIIMRDKQQRDMFIERVQREARIRGIASSHVVPTGIYVNVINFVSSNLVEVVGEIWHMISHESKHLIPGSSPLVYFPDAKDSEFTLTHRSEDDKGIFLKWRYTIKKPIQHDYAYFPFDMHHLTLPFVPRDMQERLICVPYFESYTKKDTEHIGISEQLDVAGFTVFHSSFVFVPYRKTVQWETKESSRALNTYRLQYTVSLSRRITNAVIMFFIPLLVVLITLFIRFLIAWKKEQETPIENSVDVSGEMRTYIAVFFSLIILHQTLRNQYETGKFLYIEYFFFFIYVAIILLLLHALFLRISVSFRRNISPYTAMMALWFWPINLSLWLATTLLVFY